MEQHEWSKEDIGKRCIFTNRNSKELPGVVRDIVQISPTSGYMVDVDLDGSKRPRYYCPGDMVKLV